MSSETPQATAYRLVEETRRLTKFLTFTERADLLRELVKAVRGCVRLIWPHRDGLIWPHPVPLGGSVEGVTA